MVPQPRVDPHRQLRRCPELLAIVVGAVLLRLPTVVSRAPLTFDDSVYLASVGAMRDGGLPYQDVFSSQGPAFLPLLWLADLVGLRTTWAPRLLPLLAGAAVVVIVHRLALAVSDRTGAALAAFLVATSGIAMFASDRIESDSVAAAFAAGAVLAAGTGSSRWHDIATALLIGLGLAVKSLFVGPAVLAVAWLVWRRRGWVRLVVVGAVAGLVVVVLAVPWGLAAVWDQYVGLHLSAGGRLDVARNLELLSDALRQYDRLLVGSALLAIGFVVWRRVRGESAPAGPERDVAVALWIWFGASVVVLLQHDPIFFQHLTIIVVPAAALVARHRPPLAVTTALLLVLLPSHARGAEWRISRPSPTADERAIIELIEGIEPQDGLIVSDEPALGWLAGRTSPGSLVDVSFVRIKAGDLTATDLVAAAHEPGMCAVLFWTDRLDQLPDLRERLVDYRSVFADGTAELLLRSGCDLAP